MNGDAIRAARVRAGLTQGQLAARLGVDQSIVSRWERGQRGARVPARTVAALSRVLGMTLDAILGPSSPPRPPPCSTAAPQSADPYPSRAPIVALATALEMPAAAVAALSACSPPVVGVDPGEDWWLERLTRHVELADRLAHVPTSRDATPPAPATIVRRR